VWALELVELVWALVMVLVLEVEEVKVVYVSRHH
jgi:hypothetical protein